MASDWTQSVAGLAVSISVQVTGEDVADFVRLSGDDYEAHTDEAFMARSSFKARIAHGALLVGYMSAAGTKAIRAAQLMGNDTTPVSLGYDRLRFVGPVFFGDTLAVSYRVKEVDAQRNRSIADVAVTNQAGKIVAVAEHVMKWLQPDAI